MAYTPSNNKDMPESVIEGYVIFSIEHNAACVT